MQKEATKNKANFKQQMMKAREQAVINVVYGLLATKGYDSMTVDDVINEVGIAKASLYKIFSGKEQLAIAAMIQAMNNAVDFVNELIDTDKKEQTEIKAIDFVKKITEWVMRLKLNNQMPNLPSENSVLRDLLIKNEVYMDGFMMVSDQLGEWIETAQQEGDLSKDIPAIVMLYTLYARACDPVLNFLKMGDLFTEDQIIALVMKTCFHGIQSDL